MRHLNQMESQEAFDFAELDAYIDGTLDRDEANRQLSEAHVEFPESQEVFA